MQQTDADIQHIAILVYGHLRKGFLMLSQNKLAAYLCGKYAFFEKGLFNNFFLA